VSVYRSNDVVLAARGLSEATVTEIEELRKLKGENTAALNEAVRMREEEALRLAMALLPELSLPALERAARLTGCPAFGRADLLTRLEEDRQARTAELSEIEADPRFTNAASILARLGEKRAEQLAESAPARRLSAKVQHPRLNRLIESGYDTPAYNTAFWQLEFYDDWKAGDEVLERFPDIEAFAQLRPRILDAWKTIEESDRAIDETNSRVADVEAVRQRRDELRRYLEHLDERHLELAHELLVQYLLEGDMASIDRHLFSAAPDLAEAFKSLRGTAAKALYLERINTQLDAELADLGELKNKADRDTYKWQRPKRYNETLTDTDYDRRYVVPRDKIRRRRERYARMTDTIRGYTDYSRVNLAGTVLWWDVFTDGSFDGDFIPEVSAFHQDHPDYQWPRHHLDAEEAAAATEAGLLHGGTGHGRFVDAS